MRKRLTLLMLIAATIAATGCTPKQLATWEARTGVKLPADLRADLLALPDLDHIENDGIYHPDGTFTPHVAPAGSNCPQWYGHARAAGWPAADWPKLDYIMWRESRCNPDVYTDSSDGAIFRNDNSWGLLQVNVKAGIGTQPFIGPLVGWDWSRLADPRTNLWVGRRMYEYHRVSSWAGYCGWKPWSTRDRSWC